MVRKKRKLKYAKVWPLKCVMYMSQNPIKFVIQWHRELFLKDEQAWDAKKSSAYKRHVHAPPKDHTATVMST